jgi:hypothetical protein
MEANVTVQHDNRNRADKPRGEAFAAGFFM